MSDQNFFEESKQALKKYLQDRLLLIKLQLTEKISKLVAVMFTSLLIVVIGFFIVLFLSMMAGFYFASLTGSNYIGFAIVAGFYVILLIVIIALRKRVLQKNIINMIIEVMFEKTKEEHEH
jgi:ABC-type glycerol-3-phosphate transport system permease component